MTKQPGRIFQWAFGEYMLGEGCGGKQQDDHWGKPESPRIFADSLRWYVSQPDIPIVHESTMGELLSYLDSVHRNYAYRVVDASMIEHDIGRRDTIFRALDILDSIPAPRCGWDD